MLNINRLQLLREVANRKTIAATADAFFMTPSAVSQQLSVLEREAGVPLLKKAGRGVELTTAGNLLVKNSEEIFAAIERAEAQLIDTSKGLSGNVKISPYQRDGATACAYCEYQGICGFDQKIQGYEYRKLKGMDTELLMKAMQEITQSDQKE